MSAVAGMGWSSGCGGRGGCSKHVRGGFGGLDDMVSVVCVACVRWRGGVWWRAFACVGMVVVRVWWWCVVGSDG